MRRRGVGAGVTGSVDIGAGRGLGAGVTGGIANRVDWVVVVGVRMGAGVGGGVVKSVNKASKALTNPYPVL